jgi:hypothetical protein
VDDDLRMLPAKLSAHGGKVGQVKALASQGRNPGIGHKAWRASDKVTSDQPAGASDPDRFQSINRSVKPA